MDLKAYQEDYKQNPPAKDVHETFMLSGGSDEENSLLRIPTADLGTFPIETMCGTVGDKFFSQDLIKLLQSAAEHIYVVGYLFNEFSEKSYNVFYMAVFCDSKTAEKIEEESGMRWDEGDSFPCWQSFESE